MAVGTPAFVEGQHVMIRPRNAPSCICRSLCFSDVGSGKDGGEDLVVGEVASGHSDIDEVVERKRADAKSQRPLHGLGVRT